MLLKPPDLSTSKSIHFPKMAWLLWFANQRARHCLDLRTNRSNAAMICQPMDRTRRDGQRELIGSTNGCINSGSIVACDVD